MMELRKAGKDEEQGELQSAKEKKHRRHVQYVRAKYCSMSDRILGQFGRKVLN